MKGIVQCLSRECLFYHGNIVRLMCSFILLPCMMVLILLQSIPARADCNPDITKTKPDNIYIDHGDGTVTDIETGLMWMKCSLGLTGSDCESGAALTYNWKQALEAAQAINENGGSLGHDDWRLPSVAELRTLAEPACYNPAVNILFFPATVGNFYWASTVSSYQYERAAMVSFYLGFEADELKSRNYHVRLVRSAD